MSEQLPKKEYKPFFNRSYLKYLGFAVAIAIIFLSEKPTSSLEQPLPLEEAISGLKVLHNDSVTDSRLLLSFSSAPALTEKAKIDRALDYQSLLQSTATADNIHSVLWTQDRLEIELRWPKNSSIDINDALSQLTRDARKYATTPARKLIAAAKYLDNKQIDNAAIQALSTRIARDYAAGKNINLLLKNTPKALLITSYEKTASQVIEIDRQFGTLFPRNSQGNHQPVSWHPSESTIEHRGTAHQLLVATQLAPISNPQSALELVTNFVLGELLNNLNAAQHNSYRLVRQPIFKRGFQAVLLASPRPYTYQDLMVLRAQMTEMAIDDAMTIIKKRLEDNYQKLVEDPERLFKFYSKKNFYGLTTQSSSEYAAQLDTITVEQIKMQIKAILGDNAIIIRLQPS